MARERKKSAKQQAADAALAEKADAKREQEPRKSVGRIRQILERREHGATMCIKLKAPQSAMSR